MINDNVNSLTVYLSSNSSSTVVNISSVVLPGFSNLILDLVNVSRHKIPINTTIRWGDNSPDVFIVNNLTRGRTNVNVIDEILYGSDYTLLRTYDHIFSTQGNSLQTNLTCQALIKYYDNTTCLFKIPLTIISPSFYSKIQDLNIVNTNFLNVDESILYTFNTAADDSVVEAALYTDN